MEEFTYEEIRAKALKQGVKDNIFQVGMWAQFNGYMKCKRRRKGKVYTIYVALRRLAYSTLQNYNKDIDQPEFNCRPIFAVNWRYKVVVNWRDDLR